MKNMTESGRYLQAMLNGMTDTAIRIEQDHDLFGYPPEIVAIGLRAFDQGRNVQDAVAAYLNGGDE
jgi:hypothetical protein